MVESAHTTTVNDGASQTDGRVAEANGKVAAVQPNARTFKMCEHGSTGLSDIGRPKPKTYADKDEETKEKLKTLAAAYRIFAAQGYDEGASDSDSMSAEQAGVAGHITLRDPKGRGFWSVWRLWMPD